MIEVSRNVVIVCGGRDFGDLENYMRGDDVWPTKEAEYNFILRQLDEILHPMSSITDDMETWLPQPGLRVVSGGGRGTDRVAIDWAVVNWVDFKEYLADWDKHRLAAGPIRNQQMLDEEKPDLVIAFPGGNGTADMVRRARKANVPVQEVAYDLSKV